MRERLRQPSFLSAMAAGVCVFVIGMVPDLVVTGLPQLMAFHAVLALVAGVLAYLFIESALLAREHDRDSIATLLDDLDTRERLLQQNLQQRRLLEAIFEADPDGIAVMAGPDLTYQLVNSAGREFTPHPEVDPAGRPYAEIWQGAGCHEREAILRQVAETGTAVDLSSEACRYPDGTVRFFGVHVRRLEWGQGHAVLMVLEDLTAAEEARRRADDAALEAQRQANELDVVFGAMAEGVVVFDTTGVAIRANPRALRLLGQAPGTTNQATLLKDLGMRRFGAGLLRLDELPSYRALRGETVRGDRFVITDGQGRERTILASASPLEVNGQVTAAVAVWRDVTELEQAEAQMRQALEESRRREAEVAALLASLETSEERWRSLVESANDAMVTLNERGEIVFWNRAAQAMFGHEAPDVIGQPFTRLLSSQSPTTEQGQTWEECYNAASALAGKSIEAVGRQLNGGEFLVEYSFAPWQTREGSFITASIRDITERSQAHERAQRLAALEERQRLARELHDSVSQALYGIALGANTALNMLDSSRERAVEALQYVLSLAELALTEMRALIFELRPDALEREGLVAGLTKQTAALRARHGAVVREELCAEPSVPLEVKEAIYRIVQEALNNAIKHARASEIRLRLIDCGQSLDLDIVDDGAGFDPAQSFPGHLGLRSMRERALKQGGRLEIDSSPGMGTVIRASFPVGRAIP